MKTLSPRKAEVTVEVTRLDAAVSTDDWHRIMQKAAAAVKLAIIEAAAEQTEKELNAMEGCK